MPALSAVFATAALFVVLQASRNRQAVESGVGLVKRNRWTLSRVATTAGILLAAAAATQQAWAPILCVTPAAFACWAMAVGVAVVAAVSSIAVGAAQFTDTPQKRDLTSMHNQLAYQVFDRYSSQYSLSNTTNHTYPALNVAGSSFTLYPPDEVYDSIVDQFVSAGLGVPLLLKSNSTAKRAFALDDNSTDGSEAVHLQWMTDLGFHTASHLPHYNVTNMASDIVEQFTSGYTGTGLYGDNQYLQRRMNRYKVDWVSYNVDNENADLERKAWETTEDPGNWEEDVANALYSNDLQDTWKWCITVMASGDSSYDSFGNSDATHGEAYTSQYGGIDNYCNDNKGGAQCSTDGCQ